VFNLESIILAAGYSTRFDFQDNSFKKYMLPFKRSNILNYIIVAMIKAGIDKINIVIDDKANNNQITESISNFVKKIGISPPILNFIINRYSERENGYSLYLGAKEVTSKNFILSMADHVFSDNIYSLLIKNYNNEHITLATDPMKLEGVYDLEDCTKVYGENLQIKKIGKQISESNRIDMGAFIMKTKSIRKISQDIEKHMHKFGVSDIVIFAINSNLNVKYLDFPKTIWLDIDNHFEYNKLNKIFNNSKKFHPFNLDFLSEKF
jgi:CDP-L-myo-inositol myo-inositolphosphotransferase